MSTSNLLPRWYRPQVGPPLARWLGVGVLVGSAAALVAVRATVDGPETSRAAQFVPLAVYEPVSACGADKSAAAVAEIGRQPGGEAVAADEPAEADGGVQAECEEVDSGNR